MRPERAASFRIERSDRGAMLHLAGELDLATAAKLTHALEELARLPDQDLVLDLSELEFIDSTGVHVLLDVANSLAAPYRLVLLAPGNAVLRCLDLLQIDRIPNIDIQ